MIEDDILSKFSENDTSACFLSLCHLSILGKQISTQFCLVEIAL